MKATRFIVYKDSKKISSNSTNNELNLNENEIELENLNEKRIYDNSCIVSPLDNFHCSTGNSNCLNCFFSNPGQNEFLKENLYSQWCCLKEVKQNEDLFHSAFSSYYEEGSYDNNEEYLTFSGEGETKQEKHKVEEKRKHNNFKTSLSPLPIIKENILTTKSQRSHESKISNLSGFTPSFCTFKKNEDVMEDEAEIHPICKKFKFINILLSILGNEKNSEIISWDSRGKSILILNKPLLISSILPKYFNYTNFFNFVRQLNLYGFKKEYSEIISYQCPYFTKDFSLLHKIKRHKNKKQKLIREKGKENKENTESTAISTDINLMKNVREEVEHLISSVKEIKSEKNFVSHKSENSSFCGKKRWNSDERSLDGLLQKVDSLEEKIYNISNKFENFLSIIIKEANKPQKNE